MGVTLTFKDERTISANGFPVGPIDLAEIASAISQAAKDGYSLSEASTIQTGQRDPYTTGVRLVFRRTV